MPLFVHSKLEPRHLCQPVTFQHAKYSSPFSLPPLLQALLDSTGQLSLSEKPLYLAF